MMLRLSGLFSGLFSGKLSGKFLGLLAMVTAIAVLAYQTAMLATAPTPPQLVSEVLGGKSVAVLYVTRSADTVLVRCYPGYQPAIAVRAMGRNPQANAPNTQKEGVLTCRTAG